VKSKKTFHSLDEVRLPAKPVHLAVGMFDGIHLGHQSVIESAIHSARRSNGLAGVLTFWPHPSCLFRKDDPTPLIMASDSKIAYLQQLGVDFIVEEKFDRKFAQIRAEDFVHFLLEKLPALKCLYVGENWKFGHKRRGDIVLLIEKAREIGVSVISAERISLNGLPISSTQIRGLLISGEVTKANELLGHSYSTSGIVSEGKRLGRTIGFPTLNLKWSMELRPAFGVYAVRIGSQSGGLMVKGVANFGVRPTVTDIASDPVLEVHVLDECEWGKGAAVVVEWMHFIRPEKKFSSVDALKAQIEIDKKAAFEFLDVG
jgi:riboflavin kinase/FMN adenylyltransferase